MDYLVSEEEAIDDMDFCPLPKLPDEHHLVERNHVSQLTLPSRAPVTGLQNIKNSRNPKERARNAQRNFRQRQKKERIREQETIEEQTRELEKQRHVRRDLEDQVRRLNAEIEQLRFRAEKWEENSKVLQGSVGALQKSLDLLHRGSSALYCDARQPTAESMRIPPSPSSSQSNPGNHVPPRNFSHLQKFLRERKLGPMISPISPMRLPPAPPRP